MFDSVQFSSIGEFLDMGGYAFNVWSVYILFAIFFLINIYQPLLRKKQIIKEQKRRLQLNPDTRNQNTGSSVNRANADLSGENP